MVSVTPDITASSSFQAPAPRGKADPSPSNDSFGSLVDGNATAAAHHHERAQDRTQDRDQDGVSAPQSATSNRRPAPSRRDDAADAAPSRDAKADKPGRDTIDERNEAAADQASADQPGETSAHERARTKSAGKSDESKAAEKPSSEIADETGSTDSEAAADSASAETADAIAAAIIVPVAAADVPAPAAPSATSAPDSGPLTIAAAALAAATALTEGESVPASTDASAKTGAEAKTTAPTAAGEQVAATAQGTAAGDATSATTTGLVLTTANARPAAPKASSVRTSAPASDATTSSGDADPSTSPSDPSATAPAATGTEQPVAAKPAVKNAHAEPVKSESAGTQAPWSAAAHLNAASPDAVPGQSNAPGNGASTIAFQPQLQASAQAQPSFTVTPTTPTAAVPLSGLAMEIAASVNSGKSRFEIRLDPAELGRIDVRIDVDRNGHVTSHLTVEKPETLSMLRQDAPQLQRALNDAGLSTGDSGLQFSLRDQSSSGQNGNQSNPNAQRLILTEEETVPAAVAGQYGRMFGANGGVDIRV